MAKRKSKKLPKRVADVGLARAHEVRVAEDPDRYDAMNPTWQFHRCDLEHADWGWHNVDTEALRRLLTELLPSWERMTWMEIKQQAGGRGRRGGTNHHPCPTDGFCRAAQRRLEDMRLDDLEALFSLRGQGQVRLYGILDRGVMRFVWYDPHHGEARGAYPTASR